MIIIEIIQYSLAISMMVLLCYQIICSIGALRQRKKISLPAHQNRHFAIVIPMSENNKMVSQSLYSVFGLVYPKNLYDVILFGNNLTKEVTNTGRELGATIFNGNGLTQDDKDRKLYWAFEQILDSDKGYDAILVVGAESLVPGNYLDIMNYYLDRGSKVVQSSYLMLPPSGLDGSRGRKTSFFLRNLLEPVGEKVLNFGVDLKGNSYCFVPHVLRDNLRSATSFNEIAEYEMMLQLQGINVDFAPEAVVWKGMPIENKAPGIELTSSKKKRFSVSWRYLPEFFKAAFEHKSLFYFEKILDIITPSAMNILIIAILMVTINVLGWAVADGSLILAGLWTIVALLGITNMIAGFYVIDTYYQAYKSLI